MDGAIIELLTQANIEIRMLRNENQQMRIRLDMFDQCMMLLTANVQQKSIGMSPDITYHIDKFLQTESEKSK